MALLLADYDHFVTDVEAFCSRLAGLREVCGGAVVEGWQHAARAGDLADAVRGLLAQHYDPIYTRSMARNFSGFGAAQLLDLPDAEAATLAAAARTLMRAEDT